MTTSATVEHAYATESRAKIERRQLIDAGLDVSLIAFDPARSLYVFDSLSVVWGTYQVDEPMSE